MGHPLTHRPTVIPPDAEEVLHGVWRWSVNGATVVLPFLSADPLKDDEDWLADTLASLPRMEGEREYLCLDPKTEVLTEAGWKLIPVVTREDRVATLTPSGVIEYHRPSALHHVPYAGSLLHWRGKSCEFLVTPNHHLYARLGGAVEKHGAFQRVPAWVAARYQRIAFARSGRWEGTEVASFTLPAVVQSRRHRDWTERALPMDPWLVVLGWYVSEGSVRVSRSGYVSHIAQRPGDDLDAIEAAVNACGFRAHRTIRPARPMRRAHPLGMIAIQDRRLAEYLVQLGKSWEKRVPDFVKTLAPRQIDLFLTALWRGDGTTDRRGRWNSYVTTSRLLADDVQELLLKTGRAGTVASRAPRPRQFPGCSKASLTRRSWIVTASHMRLTPQSTKKPVEVFYDGMVYDLTVPNHVFYVRRNGRAGWTGNCEFVGFSGKPVYPEYQDRLHLSPRPLEYVPNRPVIRGWDIPGPLACVWGQLIPVTRPGATRLEAAPLRLHVLNELYADCGVEEFGQRVRTESASQFPLAKEFVDWSDPAAFAHNANDKRSAADILRVQCQIHLRPGPVDLTARTEGVRRWLVRFFDAAKPNEPMGRILLDPSCVMLRDGFKGGYYYEEVERTGRYKEVPTKNEFSHIFNALEYAVGRLDTFDEAPSKPAARLDFAHAGYLGAPPRR